MPNIVPKVKRTESTLLALTLAAYANDERISPCRPRFEVRGSTLFSFVDTLHPPTQSENVADKQVHHGVLETNAELREIYEEIGTMADLEEDWNDENAPRIDRVCIRRAQNFVKWLASSTEKSPLAGKSLPMAFPAIDGGVSLVWRTSEHQFVLDFSPKWKGIALREKHLDELAKHSLLSDQDASHATLDFLRKIA